MSTRGPTVLFFHELTSRTGTFPSAKWGESWLNINKSLHSPNRTDRFDFHPVKVGPSDKQQDNQVARSQAEDEWEMKCPYYAKLDNWSLNNFKLFYFTTTGERLHVLVK